MAITPLPPMPSRSDTPANFITKADAFLAALNVFATEVDAVGVGITLVATNSTSVTSLTNALGSQSLTVGTGKSYMAGMTVKIAAATSTPVGSVWMLGDVTSYNSSTGALVVNINVIQGTGTFASWAVFQSAPGGARPGANTDITSLDSPALGSATATTQADSDNSSKLANTAFVMAEASKEIGSIFMFGGLTPPTNCLTCPTGQSLQSTTGPYAALFAKFGYLWGGSGTSFGIPFCEAGMSFVQNNGTIGTLAPGSIPSHAHAVGMTEDGLFAGGDLQLASTGNTYSFRSSGSLGRTNGDGMSGYTGSGSSNYPTGRRVQYCVKYK